MQSAVSFDKSSNFMYEINQAKLEFVSVKVRNKKKFISAISANKF